MTSPKIVWTRFAGKLPLAGAGIAFLAVPLFIGVMNAPRSHAQTKDHPDAGLKFEVASVKPADPTARTRGFGRTAGGGLRATGITLRGIISMAYDVPEFLISGGPGWTGSERYDILAKPERPDGPDNINDATDAQRKSLWDQLRERTRALLAERFQLAVHKDVKEANRYALVLGKNGHKLKAWKEGDIQTGLRVDLGQIAAQGATTEMLVTILSGLLGSPVLDQTGLQGRFNFTATWTPDPGGVEVKQPPGEKGPSMGGSPDEREIISAIQEQLGLKVESKKGPVDIIVIDRAEKPSAN